MVYSRSIGECRKRRREIVADSKRVRNLYIWSLRSFGMVGS